MAQLLGIGTKVKFLATTDSGIIVEKLGNGMVMVKLDDFDMDIPAFEEDLVRAEDFISPPIVIPTSHPKQKEKLKKNQEVSPLSTKPVFTGSGVHIVFDPVKKPSGEIEKFDILLLNDTQSDIVFSLDFILFDNVEWTKDGILKAISFEKIGELLFDVLNDQPQLEVSIKPIYTEGAANALLKTLKIKPKQFLKNRQLLKFIAKEVHLFTLFESFDNKTEPTHNDLTNYTKEIIQKTKTEKFKTSNNIRSFDPVPNVNEYASFVPELDLHIEMLHESPQTLTNDEIVRFQIREFEYFLAKATRLNIPKIYIIHGIGKGRLRDLIAARLRRHPDILMFKNEYHERYGFGATEVWLR